MRTSRPPSGRESEGIGLDLGVLAVIGSQRPASLPARPHPWQVVASKRVTVRGVPSGIRLRLVRATYPSAS